MVRQPRHLADRDWFSQVEVVDGDAAFLESLLTALLGVEITYHLIHSMGAGAGFTDTVRHTATRALSNDSLIPTMRVFSMSQLGNLPPTPLFPVVSVLLE